MRLFTRNKSLEVESFLLKLVNNNCPQLRAMIEGPRLDRRVNLTVVVAVIPLEKGRPQMRSAFTAVTKEFSTRGVGVVLNEPLDLEELILGFRWHGDMSFLRGTARHVNPFGGGFYHLGVRLTEVLARDEFPEVRSIDL